MASCTATRIYQRGHTWYVDLRWSDGRRERTSAGHTKAQAERLVRKRIREEAAALRRRENAEPEPGPPFDELADRYVEHLRVHAKPASVDAAYRSLQQLKDFYWDTDAATLRGAEVDRFIAHRRRTCQPPTINKDLRYLKATLRLAIEEGRLKEMPCRVRMVREVRKAPTILSRDEMRRLLSKAGRLRPMLMMAAMTGLRNGELRYLLWADVDLEGATLHVTAKQGFSPKSGSERSVPLNSVLAEALREHRASLPRAATSDWVFQRNPSSGSQWPDSALCAAVRDVFETADLYDPSRKIGLHMLRRSFCSHSLSRGASIEAVRAMGGWSSLAVVQRYAVSVEDEQRRAVERLVELAD